MLSECRAQPAEMFSSFAFSRMATGRVTSGWVSAPTSVLRLCEREETDYGQHNRKDARRWHKEGNSSGHGLPTPGNPFAFYSPWGAPGTLQVQMSASRQKLEVFALKKGLSVARLFSTLRRGAPSRLITRSLGSVIRNRSGA